MLMACQVWTEFQGSWDGSVHRQHQTWHQWHQIHHGQGWAIQDEMSVVMNRSAAA
jgi:hypothetical protein